MSRDKQTRTPAGYYIGFDKLGDDKVRLNVFGPNTVQHIELTPENVSSLKEALLELDPEDTSPEAIREKLKGIVKEAIDEDRQEEKTRELQRQQHQWYNPYWYNPQYPFSVPRPIT